MNPIVYLAGPIAGTENGEAFDWRSYVNNVLRAYGLDTLDPMRAKQALGRAAISKDFHDYERNGVFFTAQGIMTRDFTDVKRCDALLVNLLGASIASLGTVMELGWAYALQKPVVVAIEQTGNPHDNHPMIHAAIPFRVDSLDDAIDAVAVILGR